MVKLSLAQLKKLNVSLNDLFNTNISCILYYDIRLKFPASTELGKSCRRICRLVEDFDEDLPNVTVVSAEDVFEIPKKKSFQSLFSRGQSNVLRKWAQILQYSMRIILQEHHIL